MLITPKTKATGIINNARPKTGTTIAATTPKTITEKIAPISLLVILNTKPVILKRITNAKIVNTVIIFSPS